MGRGHLGIVMLLSGAFMVLVPLAIGVLIAAIVLRDRRRKRRGDAPGAEDGTPRDEAGGRR